MNLSAIIIAPDAFHLGWMGSTKRIFQIACAFKKLGYQPVLIAAKMINPKIQSSIDNIFPGIVIRTKHTGAYPSIIDNSKFTRRAWRAGWKINGEKEYWANLHLGWANQINIDFLKNQFKNKLIQPILAWGVSAGYLDGAAGAQKISKEFDVPWFFELHDPPRNAGIGKDLENIKDNFKQLLFKSSKVIVTAESYGAYLEKVYGLPKTRSTALHLTFDGEIKNNNGNTNSTEFNLLYAGSLNGGRSLGDLIKAIHLASKIEPKVFEKFTLNLAGTGPGFDEIKKISSNLGIEKYINYLGIITPNEVEKLITSASAIVIAQEKLSFMQVPGKVFDAIKHCKPIIGIMPADCEASIILNNSGLGLIKESNDINGISEALINLWENLHIKNNPIKANIDYINEFSTENLPNKIKVIIKNEIK